MIKISIILPSIRTDNLESIYRSILSSTKRSFELIVVGPHSLPQSLQHLKNIKYVKDFGSPVRASQIGASLIEGNIILWSADDALFIPDALDKNIDLLLGMQIRDGSDKHLKNVVVAKYFEGQNGTTKDLQPDEYFQLGGSDWTSTPFIPKKWWLFNVAVMYREFFEELGGWSCQYEGTFYSHADMAVRAQYIGANVMMSPFPMLDCDHNQIDHSPIENAQVNNDKPLFQNTYGNPNWRMNDLRLDMNNWKKSDIIWKKRFK